jgi:hypothetical protein
MPTIGIEQQKTSWREGRADEGSVAPIGDAHDRDFLAVGDALSDCPFDGVDQIVVHLACMFPVACVDERLSEPR